MRTAPVAGHAGDRGDHRALLIFVHAEIFFIDLAGHAEHMTGDILFGFVIAGEIQVMGGAVLGKGMAEITFNAQGGLPVIHDLVQLFVADILGEDLQIALRVPVRRGQMRTGSGHSDHHECEERGGDSKLFVMQHD